MMCSCDPSRERGDHRWDSRSTSHVEFPWSLGRRGVILIELLMRSVGAVACHERLFVTNEGAAEGNCCGRSQ